MFEVNQKLDEIREQYKKEYDECFHYIQITPKTPYFRHILEPLFKRERQLQERTKRFLADNRYYFTQKRMHLFEQLERKGLFGEKPKFDESEECKPRSITHGVPKKVHRDKFCVECGDRFVWYEYKPSEMCRKCRNIEPVVI